ncbi:preprotein translocase subunit SecG [candidate division KSB1 bacterium]|nr:preprotein translocase subunit SecG [candidate division KSB1 bacterium]
MLGGLAVFMHIVISIALVLVVLMQSSKGGGLAGAFGGGGGMTAAFGGRGAGTFLSKVTTVLAVLFMFSCLGQVLLTNTQGGSQSLLQQELSGAGGTSPASSLPGLPPGVAVEEQQTTTTPPDTSGN